MIDAAIFDSLVDFFTRYPYAKEMGTVTLPSEFGELPRKIRNAIPLWYKEIMLAFPLADFHLGIPNDFGQDLWVGKPISQLPLMDFKFHSIEIIAKDMHSIFPNYQLIRDGYLCIGMDNESTLEGAFINGRTDNPPLWLVFHDIGESNKELLENADMLSESITNLFKLGKLKNLFVRLHEGNEKLAKTLIDDFFAYLDDEVKQGGNALIEKLVNPERLKNGLQRRVKHLVEGNYLGALFTSEFALNDSGYPFTKEHLRRLTEIYEVCGLHVPELVLYEERVGGV